MFIFFEVLFSYKNNLVFCKCQFFKLTANSIACCTNNWIFPNNRLAWRRFFLFQMYTNFITLFCFDGDDFFDFCGVGRR